MRKALTWIAGAQTRGPAVVVTHGGATIDLLRDLLSDRELESRAPGLIQHGVPGAAITELDCDGDALTVRSIAVIDHLDVGDRTGHNR
jgi:broad specificity phosphatase PhoE